MGKRSNFKRVERDFYRTPFAAVKPLLPHLPARFSYWEPCAGDGALIDALWDNAGQDRRLCEIATDVEPQANHITKMDALSDTPLDVNHCDFIITNPPWDVKILHPMIEKFSDIMPTWLLFYADWIHTKQSTQFMPRLRKVVSVGRVKWIPDSKMSGKDNCAWHLFDNPSDEVTQFYGRTT